MSVRNAGTVFEYPLEFVEKIEMVLSDEKLYNECLDNQNALIEKYYNYEWINNYINMSLDKVWADTHTEGDLKEKPKNER